jgi:putative SOS response-associated peptidase YedK
MPLAIEPEGHQAWLEGTGGELPAPLGADRIRARPVGTRVNKPANDDPGCIDPPAADAGGLW